MRGSSGSAETAYTGVIHGRSHSKQKNHPMSEESLPLQTACMIKNVGITHTGIAPATCIDVWQTNLVRVSNVWLHPNECPVGM